jgi:quercetin dioxygenase-like cupin family protein
VHDHHTDAFYVLDGELAFTVASEGRRVTVSTGDLVAVPRRVPHWFRTAGDRPARWLTIHAREAGSQRSAPR